MKKATPLDRDLVVMVICQSFLNNPHISYILKRDMKYLSRLKTLADYVFDYGLRRKAIYISEDNGGIAIILKKEQLSMGCMDMIGQIKLAFKAITLSRVLKIQNIEGQIKSRRAKSFPFIYVWFFGVSNEALGTETSRIMMKFIFSLSEQMELPIIMETSSKRIQVIYKRFGFKEYNFYETPEKELTMWYMIRDYDRIQVI